jgi:hypothetical protein
MDLPSHHRYTAFQAGRQLASGPLPDVASALLQAPAGEPVLVFSDATGEQVELDLRGDAAEVRARYGSDAADPAPARGRGRPKLGVVAREVTLLPEHWEWLAAQPGGASVALRKLVLQAMRAGGARERGRRAQERSYKVMAALAGDRPGFEEAARALFAGDLARLRELTAAWPHDISAHVLRLADPDHDPAPAPPAT